jgi:uncharacterized protein (DUF302 family)
MSRNDVVHDAFGPASEELMDLRTTPYGHVVASKLPYEDAVDRAKALLKDEGFGVLCEIDVARTLHEKTGKTFHPYLILGACNPPLAYEALSADPQLGLLLPCNVVIQEEDGRTTVSAIDTRALLAITGEPELLHIADEVNARLVRVLEKIAG